MTAQRVLMRVFGILLAAIAVQALFNGLGASGLLAPRVSRPAPPIRTLHSTRPGPAARRRTSFGQD